MNCKITPLSGLAAVAAMFAAATVQAGSPAPAAQAPAVAMPAAAAVSGPADDWTGFYVGGQLGYGSFTVEDTDLPDATGALYGLHAGYNHGFAGNWVLGGELTHDWSNADSDEWKVKRLTTARAKLGYAFGEWLVYGGLGYAHVRTEADDSGKSDGWMYAIGADYMVTRNWLLGIALEGYDFRDFGHQHDAAKVDAGNVKFNVSYRF